MTVLKRVLKVMHAELNDPGAVLQSDTLLRSLQFSPAQLAKLKAELSKEFGTVLFVEDDPFDYSHNSIGYLSRSIKNELLERGIAFQADPADLEIQEETKIVTGLERATSLPKKNKAPSAGDKPKKSKTPSAGDKPKKYSDSWLYTLCERYSEGLISSMELVLQMQVPPNVVEAILLVNKLPYQAARKLEISDLLHDDPRIEAAEGYGTPTTNEICAYIGKIKAIVGAPDSVVVELLTDSRHAGRVGIKFYGTQDKEYIDKLFIHLQNCYEVGISHHVVSTRNTLWLQPSFLANPDVSMALPESFLARLYE